MIEAPLAALLPKPGEPALSADAMLDRIDDRPVWLSTAGMGIAWLHIRLDDRPKYYGYREYR